MRYHSWPSKGTGTVYSSSSTNSITDLKAVLNRNYNWDNMPNTLSGEDEYKQDEVAYLMKDLAVVNQAKNRYI